MSSVTQLMSLITAASMMLSGTLNAAAPQHDIDGPLFLATGSIRCPRHMRLPTWR